MPWPLAGWRAENLQPGRFQAAEKGRLRRARRDHRSHRKSARWRGDAAATAYHAMIGDDLPAGYIPLRDGFLRLKKARGDGRLALHGLKSAFWDGKIPVVEQSYLRAGPISAVHTRPVEALFWGAAKLVSSGGLGGDHDQIKVVSDKQYEDRWYYYFVRLREAFFPHCKKWQTGSGRNNPGTGAQKSRRRQSRI
jgi:hypothetical protein